MSKTHKSKNAMRVHAPKLICSTGVSNSVQTFKLVFCMCNKLRLQAAILKASESLTSSYPRSKPVNLECEQWRTVKSLTCTQRKQPWLKFEA